MNDCQVNKPFATYKVLESDLKIAIFVTLLLLFYIHSIGKLKYA